MATAMQVYNNTTALTLGASDAQKAFVGKLMPYLPQLAAAVPKQRAVEHYLTLTLRLAVEQPKVLQCTPESVVSCLIDVARWRLEIGHGVYLIPRDVKQNGRVIRTDLTTIKSYHGLVQLMVRAGALDAYADVVYETDAFEYNRAERRVVRHDRIKRGTPEQIVGAYGVVVLPGAPGGIRKAEYLDRDEIEEHRAKSSRKDGDLWTEHYPEACKKTAIRAMSKYIPQDADRERKYSYDDPDEFMPPAHVFESVPMVSTGAHPYGDEAMGGASTVERAEAVTARVQPARSIDERAPLVDPDTPDEPYCTSDGEVVDEADAFEPPCPVCGGDMWDNRATKTNPRQPDFKCKKAPKTRGGAGCEGVIWPPRSN